MAVADVEFEQFHPTALHHPAMPRPLLSEALRGHGALLRDTEGDRFVDELLPRDKVSRAITARMLEQGVEHLWLDATDLERFAERFPTIIAALAEAGLDPATDWLPVAPAAHYSCGGVVADLDGASTLPGLWVAGEVACNGVHGANRLASNSLLDGMVFGPRVVEAIDRGVDGPERHRRDALGAGRRRASAAAASTCRARAPAGTVGRDELQRTMTAQAGVLRSAESLERAARRACAGAVVARRRSGGLGAAPTSATVGRVLCCRGALAREESRGRPHPLGLPRTRPPPSGPELVASSGMTDSPPASPSRCSS